MKFVTFFSPKLRPANFPSVIVGKCLSLVRWLFAAPLAGGALGLHNQYYVQLD